MSASEAAYMLRACADSVDVTVPRSELTKVLDLNEGMRVTLGHILDKLDELKLYLNIDDVCLSDNEDRINAIIELIPEAWVK